MALDTEGDSLHHYPERLALLQLAVPTGGAWLVDPLALPSLEPLIPVFADPAVEILVHAGDNDFAHLKGRHGFRFGRVFDTSVAARFLGGRALGLDVLLEQYLGVHLPPSRQRDDWSMRPLSPEQETYAIADVLHLFALRRRLEDELDRIGRRAWVEEECAALAAEPPPVREADPDAYLRLRGARELPPRALTVLRQLHAAREEAARAADRPPFKVLSEDLLVALARAQPLDRASLSALPGVTPRLIGRWGDVILGAVRRGLAAPEVQLPRPERRPRAHVPAVVSRRVETLRTWREGAVARVGLEAGVVLPNRLIRAIAEAGPRSLDALARVDGVRRWRVEAFGPELVAAVTSA